MGLLLENLIVEIFLGSFLLLWIFYWYIMRGYDYWEQRGVPFIKPQFPFGSTKEITLAKTFIGKAHENFYNQFPNERFYGILEFHRPTLVVRDPELIKMIMVKDFQCFTDRGSVIGNTREYIMKHLVNLVGQEWKDMRAKLTPTFTSGKIKLMFALMEKCSEQLQVLLESEIQQDKNIDVKTVLSKFTMDVIASCAFGVETSALTEEGKKFYAAVKGPAKKPSIKTNLTRMLALAFPSVVNILRLNLVRPELRDFLTNMVRNTVEHRQKNNIKRNDFVDLLMNIKYIKDEWEENRDVSSKSNDQVSEGLTIEEMTAQSFVFFLAGFETASSLMTFCLLELACNPHIQEQLYQQIQEAVDRNEGKISYQMMTEIPLMDQVINETLRLYGTVHVLTRKCTQPYKIPDSDFTVEKDMKVIIPVYALHHDPQYYPDPYEFKPERFLPEETKKRHPYVFLPFGEGPRNCIGMRFGLLQAKVGLATVMLNFQANLPPEQEVPVQFNNQAIILMPAKPILLKFSHRKNV
uniref:Cytochrome P450 n=2 Tax=Graphocephala atropunctata TaxID=36148 RepID=A0A1B6KCQ8_9HEMI